MDSDQSLFPVKVPSDDEDSFVVLGTASLIDEESFSRPEEEVLPPIRTSKVHDMQNLIRMEISQINSSENLPDAPPAADALNVVSSTVTNLTLSPDSSHEEIQKHVEELIKENEKLKNIIAQNNISMKNQYDRIMAWKDEVNSVMKTYKDKFGEAKTIIDKHKEENAKLGGEIEVYINIKKLQEEEILSLRQKIKEYENKQSVVATAEQNMTEFDLNIATEKIKDLQNELAEANLKKNEISAENEKLLEKMIGTPRLEESLQNREEQINNLQLDLAASKNREKDLSDEILKMKNRISELEQAASLNERLERSKATDTITSMESVLKARDAQISKLEEEQKQAATELESTKAKLASLQKLHNPNLHTEYQQVRHQLSASQMTITAQNQEIEAKAKEIVELRNLLQSTSSKSDEIFALNAQLTVYKNDFEAEKESKNAIKREKDQLAEDLQHLQKRNSQLQNEIEAFRARGHAPKVEGFMCPKCSFGFNNYQSLENHVHRCLDLDGFP